MCGSNINKRPPAYELFFAPLIVVFDPNTLESVQFAYIASKYGHYRQTRDDGSRYFDHPKGATWIYINEFNGRDARLICDILLHDLSEDTYLLSPYRISKNFDEDIALDVRAVTKLPKGKETVQAYLGRIIIRGPRAITAKLCDRLHNLRTLNSSSSEKQKRQIVETLDYYIPMLISALKEYGGIWMEYAQSLEQKMREAMKQNEMKIIKNDESL